MLEVDAERGCCDASAHERFAEHFGVLSFNVFVFVLLILSRISDPFITRNLMPVKIFGHFGLLFLFQTRKL